MAQRVEILLREGIDKPETWMGVKAYEAPTTPTSGDVWAIEWERLHSHHLTECAFLRDVVKELCEQVKALDEQLDKRYLEKT